MYRDKYITYVTASKIVTAGIQSTTHDYCLGSTLVIGAAASKNFRFSQDGQRTFQFSGSVEISGSEGTDGYLFIPSYIQHSTDTIHQSRFGWAGADQFALYVGNQTYYRLFASSTGLTIGAGDDYDFIVQSNNDAKNIFSEGGTDKVGIGTGAPQEKLTVEGSISQSGALYGQVGSGVIVSSSVSDTTLFSVQHPISGSVFEIGASGVGSGSLALSGSLLLNNNDLPPAVSESRLYNSGSNLFWGGGDLKNPPTMIAPHIHTEVSTYYTNTSNNVYIPWGIDFESTSITSGYVRGVFPYSGRVLSITLMSTAGTMDSTDVSFHKDENTTAIETTNINIADADTPYTAYFSASTFDANDLLHIKVSPTGTQNIVNCTTVIQLDIHKDWPDQV